MWIMIEMIKNVSTIDIFVNTIIRNSNHKFVIHVNKSIYVKLVRF